jgi:hypothetical protein
MKRRQRALGGGFAALAVGAAGSVGSLRIGHSHAAFVYLSAFGFVMSTLLGVLVLLAIMQAVSARWFVVLRGLVEAVASSAFVLPLLLVPLAVARRILYPETALGTATAPDAPPASLFGLPWMGSGPFLLRSVLYLALWLAYAEALRRASRAEARARPSWFLRRRRELGAVAVVVLGFSGTWATFDWLMSAIPGWNMTSVGLYVLTGGFVSALGVVAVLVAVAERAGVLPPSIGAAHSHALGRLLFASVCLWAYVAVSQLIIVWSADLPREAAFYLPRARGAYRLLAGTLVFGHFVLPFFLLLSRAWKRRTGFVAALGAWLVVMHAVDLYWLVAPGGGAAVSLFDVAPFCGLTGLCVVAGLWLSSAREVVPVRDRELARSLGYESP